MEVAIPCIDDLIATKRFAALSRSIQPVTDATRARLKALAEEPLPLEEWRRRAAIPLTDDEREHTLELVRWFRRRYPTAADRLAHARRAYKRWARSLP